MNPKDKNRISFLAEVVEQNAKEIRMLTENGDMVKEYFAIDLDTNELFARDVEFKKLELTCQKSERKHIAITMLKSVLEK